MRTLRLLLAAGLSLAPALAAAAAGTTPAFAGGGAGMTLTATMDGQDQRLLVGTKHTVHITVVDTPGEADLRDITISLSDLDPDPLPVTCPSGLNGHLSLEPEESLECTSVITAGAGYRTLVAGATAHVPSDGTLVRTASLHYIGFTPPPPPPPQPPRPPVGHTPVAPGPAPARPPHAPVLVPPPPVDSPHPVDAPKPEPVVGKPGKAPDAPDAPDAHGCASGGGSGACCGEHEGRNGDRCCGSGGRPGDCVRHGGLAVTGMSTPMLGGAALGGLVLVAGGFVLVRRFAER